MVYPSERRDLLVCLIEALSMGIPIVSSDRIECRDLPRFSPAPLYCLNMESFQSVMLQRFSAVVEVYTLMWCEQRSVIRDFMR